MFAIIRGKKILKHLNKVNKIGVGWEQICWCIFYKMMPNESNYNRRSDWGERRHFYFGQRGRDRKEMLAMGKERKKKRKWEKGVGGTRNGSWMIERKRKRVKWIKKRKRNI